MKTSIAMIFCKTWMLVMSLKSMLATRCRRFFGVHLKWENFGRNGSVTIQIRNTPSGKKPESDE
ncbi:hypothetical protein TBK1r_01490 [Stieleria magnilauensis]|uniref:Uncharacterized protein n=1 Tax=Stieleria magnilauensis TaxID=2527963 RepID=A0ABX5XMW0_9BACT|nr:hypothetical protein TBK1r_01490 [Planctomycetes bacterium TBK1r]